MLDGYIPDKSAFPGARIASFASPVSHAAYQPVQVNGLLKAEHESDGMKELSLRGGKNLFSDPFASGGKSLMFPV